MTLMYWLPKLSISYFPFFVSKTNFGRCHNSTAKCYLRKTERILRSSPVAIEFDEGHVASGDNYDDRL
jgi:hypothetical protein